ncbi:MAG: S8 family serine peptidase [Steroidobacteraceae bacterium]
MKFRDNIGLPYDDDDVARHLEERNIGPWRRLTDRFPGISIRTLFSSVEPDRIRELVAEAVNRNDSYRAPDFFSYFVIDVPAETEIEDLVRVLSKWESIETAYFDPPGEDPGGVSASDRVLRNPGHVDRAPDGIDARFAWEHQGGDGAGQRIVDLEKGWTLDHQDIVGHGVIKMCGANIESSRPHGTSVLGVVCAAHGHIGGLGIAPNVGSVKVISHFGTCNGKPASISSAVLAVINSLPLDSGAVLLLEVQRFGLPAEFVDDTFDAVELAVERGITVVEAAGNGGVNGVNLDNFENANGERILSRAFRDSGAIMVAAAKSRLTPGTNKYSRIDSSNYGSRIDCCAWGENVSTATSTANTPFSTDGYRLDFDGTSSAAAIIAGVALLVQGMAMKGSLGGRLDAVDLRAVLASHGTPSDDPVNEPIGVMPDLRAIIESGDIGVVLPLVPPQ